MSVRAPPAAGVVDRRPAPDPRGAVEVEPVALAPAALLLDGEVPVDGERLDPRQHRGSRIRVVPARLDERQAGIGDQDGNEPPEEVGRRDEVGIEQGHELAVASPRCPSASAPALNPDRSAR